MPEKSPQGGDDKKIIIQALLLVGLILFISQLMHDIKPGIDPVLRRDNDKIHQRKIIEKLVK